MNYRISLARMLAFNVLATFLFSQEVLAQLNTLSSYEFQVSGISKTVIETDGNVTVTGTPTAVQHLTTKAYVDAAVASAGGLAYAGLTTASYDGGWGNLQGMAAKCQIDYANSRPLFLSDIKDVMLDIVGTTSGWVVNDQATATSTAVNCYGFGSNSSSHTGTYFNGNAWNNRSCDNSHKIHCVYK